MNFINDVVGNTFKFYGVYDNSFKIGDQVFEVLEDQDDGYRSYLDTVESVNDEQLVFLNRSFANVKVTACETAVFIGFCLVDTATGHTWLKFGTCTTDDWYPYFVFKYQTEEYKNY